MNSNITPPSTPRNSIIDAIALNAPMFRRLERRLDVLKPTLQLIYNPDLNNSDLIQNIDSQQVKLDQTSLFSLNRLRDKP